MLAGAAFNQINAFAQRASQPRPEGRGRGREPSRDGVAPGGSEEGHVRGGRSMSGEYQVGVELRQPRPRP